MADARVPPRRKTTIEIPLPSVRKYVPGSGPPPPRISLAPPRDSTAYIIDQFVLPADKDTTEASRRLIYYHIGFTDLPAARLLIPCNKVLDYVSPRELEDWEYKNLERKEEEQARRRAEEQRAGPQKKRPGRSTKVPMDDVGVPALSPADEALLLAQQVAGPSLSTPQKRRLGRMLDEEDVGDTSNADSDDAAIRRQLQAEAESEGVGFEDELGLESESESVDQLSLHYDTPAVDSPSRPGSLVPSGQVPFPLDSARTPIKTGSPGSATAPTSTLPLGNSPGPATERLHPAWARVFGQQNWSDAAPRTHNRNGHPQQNGTPRSQLSTPQQLESPALTATAAPVARTKTSPAVPASRFSTPGVRTGSVAASDSSSNKRKMSAPNGAGPQEKQRKTKKQKVKQEEEPPTDEFEVEDLLDDQWFVEQGVKVHKYLVLWAGDWPEDQNPTWEPAENVQDQALIKRYLRKKKAGLLKPVKKPQKSLRHYLGTPQYSSVAEAFEGGIGEQAGPVADDVESDVDPPHETFLVTENVEDIAANGARPSPAFASFDSLLARYSQSFPRG